MKRKEDRFPICEQIRVVFVISRSYPMGTNSEKTLALSGIVTFTVVYLNLSVFIFPQNRNQAYEFLRST